MPNLAAAGRFYTQVWHLTVAARGNTALYLRGSRTDHHLLALHQASGSPTLRQVTLRARSAQALSAISAATLAAGGVVECAVGPASDPAGGQSLLLRDADGRRFEVVFGDAGHADSSAPEQPSCLAHVVLNSANVAHTQAFLSRRWASPWLTAPASWPS